MQAGATGSADSIASADIVENGKIRAVSWVPLLQGMNAEDDFIRVELSFGSSNTFNTNDVRQSIHAFCAVVQGLITVGVGPTQSNGGVDDLDLDVVAGERLHLHSSISAAGVSGEVSCYIYVDDKSGTKTRARR